MTNSTDEHGDLPLFSAPPPRARQAEVIAVSELNRRAKNLLEANLELLWVRGELSNVIRAASGHWYFSLKDSQAQVRCVMFKSRAAATGFTPENGMQVEVRALPSLYEPRGEFQLGVENMRRAGMGAMFEAFERLKAKLAAEGLFDDARKLPLPAFPRAIGIVTSLKAAALRDVLTTLRRRAPMVRAVIYPAAVQGAGAAAELAAAVDAARGRVSTDGLDALIVCRGGGSIEDLWSFNDEGLARAIARFQRECGVPVVSGVGHETDFSICDFVADRRAPTPTAAAEMLTPDVQELLAQLAAMRHRQRRCLKRALETAEQKVDHAARGLVSPAERIARERGRLSLARARMTHAQSQRLQDLVYGTALLRRRHAALLPDVSALRGLAAGRWSSLADALSQRLAGSHQALASRGQALSLLNPQRVLERGYAIVSVDGGVLRDAAHAKIGDALSVRLAKGRLDAEVTGTDPA